MQRYRPAQRNLTDDEATFIELFQNIERARWALYGATTDALAFLNRHAALRENWECFIESGGATADELRDQYRGRRYSQNRQISRRHLIRCIVNNVPAKDSKLPSRVYYNNGPEAA